MDLFFETTELIQWGGFLLIAIFVFAETGLLLGLIIPGGETLTFSAGLLVSTNSLDVSIVVLLITLTLMAIAGDACGFVIGRKLGVRLYQKEDTWYFKKKYLALADKYLEEHYKTALITAKFLPVIRPFAPVISGITHVKFPVFISISAIACTLYMCTFILAGYIFGNRFPEIKDYLGWIFPISIVIAVTVAIIQFRKLQAEGQ